MAENDLYVQMLGDFQLIFQGETISLGMEAASKPLQLLAYLLCHPEGVSRERLLEAVYSEERVLDAANCMHGVLHRLRRSLAQSPLPPENTICYQEGKYRWTGSAQLDFHRFEALAARAVREELDGAGKRALLREAVELYHGELLPAFSDCEWVAAMSVPLRDSYLRCVRELSELQVQSGESAEAVQLCGRAIRMYPYQEELYLSQIRALFNECRYQEATETYQRMVRLFQEELDVSPSPQTEGRYCQMCMAVKNRTVSLEEIEREITEKNTGDGACYFDYPTFISEYQLAVRRMEREKKPVRLMLCMTADRWGQPLEDKQRVNQAARELDWAIRQAVRKSDAYTRYSRNQYLVLLVGVEEDACTSVKKRIEEAFFDRWTTGDVRLVFGFLAV